MTETTFMKCACSDIDDKISKLKQDAVYSGKKQPKLYFAGPWFTTKGKLLMDGIIEAVEHLGSACKYNVYFPKQHTATSPYITYNDNIDAIDEADVVIALVCEKDVGTAFEIGYAKAKNKDIYLLGYDKTCFESKTNIMLAFAGDDNIVLDDLMHFLRDEDYQSISVADSWENKE